MISGYRGLSDLIMERISPDRYRLSSGREISANHGIIGLEPGCGTVFEGYDGIAVYANEEPWTPEEIEELRAFMIAAWQQWHQTHPPSGAV